MYRHRVGEGGVLYLALGHANRPFDTPRPDSVQPDHRGPWEMPVYKELIRRGVALGRPPRVRVGKVAPPSARSLVAVRFIAPRRQSWATAMAPC